MIRLVSAPPRSNYFEYQFLVLLSCAYYRNANKLLVAWGALARVRTTAAVEGDCSPPRPPTGPPARALAGMARKEQVACAAWHGTTPRAQPLPLADIGVIGVAWHRRGGGGGGGGIILEPQVLCGCGRAGGIYRRVIM